VVSLVMDAARAQEGGAGVQLRGEELGEIVAAAVRAQEPEARGASHSIPLNSAELPVNVLCDREKLLVVLRNLLENALKYSPAGSEIEIGYRGDGQGTVWVADRGAGVPADEKQAIFEKFHRVHAPGAAEVGGSGLGLFLVRSLLEMQGGSVRVEDRLGGGSVFSCYIQAASSRSGEGELAGARA
jgi:signal transduction histidine kinase